MYGYKYLNLHPGGKSTRDCVKRAIALATGRPYLNVAKELNALKKLTGAKAFNSNENWKRYVKDEGWEKLSFPAERGKPRMNGHRFTKAFPKGTYILNMAHHLTTCVDGVIYDLWDCRDKCVYTAWLVANPTTPSTNAWIRIASGGEFLNVGINQ